MAKASKKPAKDSPEKEKKVSDYQAHMASWESKKDKKAKKIAGKDLKFLNNEKGDSNVN